jgi:peroxiredoxin Q/BCP
LDLNYAILSDPNKQVARAYGVVSLTRPLPHRWTFFIGADGNLLAVDKKVKPGSHGADVVARLNELGVAKKKEK